MVKIHTKSQKTPDTNFKNIISGVSGTALGATVGYLLAKKKPDNKYIQEVQDIIKKYDIELNQCKNTLDVTSKKCDERVNSSVNNCEIKYQEEKKKNNELTKELNRLTLKYDDLNRKSSLSGSRETEDLIRELQKKNEKLKDTISKLQR